MYKNFRKIYDFWLPEGSREPLGGILEGLGGVLEPLEGFVGASSASKSHLEPSWNPLGRVLDHLGRVWKPSWRALGRSWSGPGGSSGSKPLS